jgi:hypothetical protein
VLTSRNVLVTEGYMSWSGRAEDDSLRAFRGTERIFGEGGSDARGGACVPPTAPRSSCQQGGVCFVS